MIPPGGVPDPGPASPPLARTFLRLRVSHECGGALAAGGGLREGEAEAEAEAEARRDRTRGGDRALTAAWSIGRGVGEWVEEVTSPRGGSEGGGRKGCPAVPSFLVRFVGLRHCSCRARRLVGHPAHAYIHVHTYMMY